MRRTLGDKLEEYMVLASAMLFYLGIAAALGLLLFGGAWEAAALIPTIWGGQ